MGLNMMNNRAVPLDRQRCTWRDTVPKPPGTLDDVDGSTRAPAASARTALADAPLRAGCANEAEPTVPVRKMLALAGVAKAGLDVPAGKHPQALMDKLGERLAFEHSGVRLYDALLAKCRVAAPGLPPGDLETLQRFRDHEAQHMALVTQAIHQLGGDPTARTPGADLVGVECAGLVQAMNEPRTSLLQGLQVMLDAELIDNASWDLLIRLARSVGHEDIAQRFGVALHQENVHLQTLHVLVRCLAFSDAGVNGRPT